jgi:hypothetical protein
VCFTDLQWTLTCSEEPYGNQSYQTSNWKLSNIVDIDFHVILQSMWDSIVSTVTWLWANKSARDLSLLQNIHPSYITHTFFYSIGTTGSIPESG